MKVLKYPDPLLWKKLMERPVSDDPELRVKVERILGEIKKEGDEAVCRYARLFDEACPASLEVTPEEWDEGKKQVSPALQEAIRVARENIDCFHRSQCIPVKKVITRPGVVCWQKAVGIDRVGLYIPGGTAPLFSTVLMLAVPARIAGCGEVVICTPPRRDGTVHPAVLFAAAEAGVDRIYKIGGIQAIGAMAYGTRTVRPVDKIFGPGNTYVTEAKRQVSCQGIAIDMPAGPSEVAIIADRYADPVFVAADFLSQAEHGADSQSLLLTSDEELIGKVEKEIQRQLPRLPRKELVGRSLAHSRLILLRDPDEIIAFVNAYAPEHLIIQTVDYGRIAGRIRNAGSVFLGPYSPESAGDYASGTNHTLPTHGFARAYSGVNTDSFLRKITFQEISPEGLGNIGEAVRIMAEAEGLEAHRNAVTVRLNALK